MKPLVTNEEFFRFNFYNIMIESIKHHKNAMNPTDEQTNLVSAHSLVGDVIFAILLSFLFYHFFIENVGHL